ncbi:MAG TPA: DUF5719 family protein [Acidimicrobiales bacterium]|nr:DUF5719 family protein [Acidimicrobiales bacterium]
MNATRGPAILVLAAMTAAAAALSSGPVEVSGAEARPEARAATTLDSSSTALWFCTGPTAELDGIDERTVEVVGISASPTEGRVTVVDEAGRAVERAFRIDPGDRLRISPGQFVSGAMFAGVTVEVRGGAAVVGQTVAGPDGADRRPCTTRASDTWVVPWSTTARPGNRAWVLLHNPFRAAAVADLRFVGDIGRRETLDSQGVVVPGRSIVAYDVTERIADSAVVSATIDVRVGRVVVARLQASDGSGPLATRGLDLAPGVPELATRAFIPGVGTGAVSTGSPGAGTSVVVVNTGVEAVEAEVVVRTGEEVTGLEPWRLVLRAGQRHVVDLDAGRLEGTDAFGVEVRTLDGRPIAASVVQRFGGDGVSEASSSVEGGLAVRPAAVVAARGWVVDLNDRYGATADVLAVMNPASEGIATIEVKVLAGTAPAGVARSVELAPGTQVSFDLAGGPPAVLAVESTAPVIVSIHSRTGEGATASFAVAVAGTEARPVPSN